MRLKVESLRQLVARSRRSQNAWAMRAGISRGHFSELLNGRHPYPSARTRAQILEAFGVEFNELFEIEQARVPLPADAAVLAGLGARYVIDGELCEGGMGVLYRARDRRFHRPVVVKVLSEEGLGGLGADRFLAEIQRAARLIHPYILPLYDAGEVGGRAFYVMPYIEQGSLAEVIASAPAGLPLERVLRVTEGIAAALEHAHRQGVLHCDVKPQNVLLVDGHPYVADFGLSRAIHLEALREWPRPPEVDIGAGTPAYVSPEQARAARSLDPRSDLYSLGCVVFEMLAGRPPFEGGSTTEVVRRRFEALPPPLQRLRPDLPAGVAAAVARAMALDPEQRPAHPTAFVRELRAGASSGAVSAPAAARSVRGTPRAPAGASFPIPVVRTMRSFLRDLRGSLRILMRQPTLASVAVATLAVGIGANAAIFSVVDAVALRPLPYPHAERLYRVYSSYEGELCCTVSVPNFLELRDTLSGFDAFAAYTAASFIIDGGGGPERIAGLVVTDGLLEMLGGTPQLGRSIARADTLAGADPVVLLSHRFWLERFGGDPDVLGGTLRVDSVERTIVGVTPESFRFGQAPALFVPPAWGPEALSDRGSNFLTVIARLREGTSFEAALAELEARYADLVARYPEITNRGVGVRPLRDWLLGPAQRRPVLVLWCAVTMLLLVACANVANLLLARSEARRRELAVRAALGASHARLLAQHVGEGLILAGAGCSLGVAAAAGVLRWLLARYGAAVPRAEAVRLDARVLGFSVGLALLTGLAVGLVPALRSRSARLHADLAEGGRGGPGARSRLRRALVVAQVAAAVVLLVGSSLLLRGFWYLTHVDLGVDGDSVLAFEVTLPEARYPEPADVVALLTRLRARLAALPGVEAVGVGSAAPFSNTWTNFSRVVVLGRPERAASFVEARLVEAGYFDALGLRRLRGELFTGRENSPEAPPVAINRTLARQLFGDADPIGAAIGPDPEGSGWRVVAVVSDVLEHGPDEPVPPTVYLPFALAPSSTMTVLVRSAADPLSLVPAIRGAIRRLDAEVVVFGVSRLDELVHRGLAGRRFTMTLLTAFAAIALLLAAVGIYAVMAYAVQRRTREIGIRQALGASSRRVQREIVGEGLKMAGAGTLLGLAGAMAVWRVLSSLVVGVVGADPIAFVAASVALFAVAAAACWLPARHAAALEPMAALRRE